MSLVLLSSCTTPAPTHEPDALTDALASLLASLAAGPQPPAPRPSIAGASVQGRPLEYLTYGFGPDRILIIATIHGDESAGTSLALRLAAALSADPFLLASHTLLIIPVANPDGLAANTRHNASGIDLNRNFISDQPCDHPSFGHSLSEPESRFIAQILHDFSPHRILTIHQPLACIDYDGPAQPLAEHMAPFCPLPVKKLGARPCSLGSYAGEMLQIPIITLELTAEDSNLSEPDRWQKYGQCLLSVITYPDSPTLAK